MTKNLNDAHFGVDLQHWDAVHLLGMVMESVSVSCGWQLGGGITDWGRMGVFWVWAASQLCLRAASEGLLGY